MNKQEFIEKLKSLLRVSSEDEASLVEEYEAYFEEAMANGETEEQIIQNLESPEEIAANANEELGIGSDKSFKDYVDIQFDAMKDGYEKVVDSDFMNNVSDTIENALKGVGETLKGLDIEAKVSKALEKVGEAVGKVKDINIEASFKDMAMKFDNSKVESYDYDESTLNVEIIDDNKEATNVEVLGGTSNLVIKSLPTTLMHSISLDGDKLRIHVPASNIKYAERKRMRVYVPNAVEELNIVGNVPMSVKELETSVTLDVQDVPVSVKDIEGEKVLVHVGNGPVAVKDIDTTTIEVLVKNGPVSFKSIEAEDGEIKIGDGPLSVKDSEIDQFTITAGNGPSSIKMLEGENHTYNLGAGPKTVKNIEVDVLTVEAKGGIMTMKDITVTRLAGDISGTVKTLKNIEAEEFELNK